MDQALVRRVKGALLSQHYCMNDSWLSECIEYYVDEHPNASQDEIITFVKSQWILYDLREINNENGCLPRDLASQKCTTLPGKYMLQMDKMYDISQSKFKQLEKIRHVSIENVVATENENAQDNFKNFEPKSKRMLQLFLTDGIQDVLAIEYKPIRFLKDSLYPGFKVLIKGPVKCRRGVIMLEETNIVEVGGEVDSLLVVNAVENVFARALNLDENPDPYNDKNKQNQSDQTESTQMTAMADDDFDIDSQALDEIEKQVQQQSSINSKNSATSRARNTPAQAPANNSSTFQRQNSSTNNRTPNITNPGAKNTPGQVSTNSLNSHQKQNSFTSNKTPNITNPGAKNTPGQVSKTSSNSHQKQNSFTSNKAPNVTTSGARSQEYPSSSTANHNKTSQQNSPSDPKENVMNLEDDEDLLFNLVDDKAFQNLPMSKTVFKVPDLPQPSLKKQPTLSKQTPKTSSSDFPIDGEVYDLTDSPPSTVKSKPQNKTDSFSKASCSSIATSNKNSYGLEYKDTTPRSISNLTPSASVHNKSALQKPTPVVSECSFPDDNFDFGDIKMETDDFNDHFSEPYESKANSAKSSQSSINSAKLKAENVDADRVSNESKESKTSLHSSHEVKSDIRINSVQQIEPEFEDDFETEFEAVVEKDTKSSIQQIDRKNFSVEERESSSTKLISQQIRTKRSGDPLPVAEETPLKVRCLQSTPKSNKSNEKKITDFLTPSPDSVKKEESPLLTKDGLKCYELLKDVLKDFYFSSAPRKVIVRGIVINVVKLNMLKNDKGVPYFHLEATITDNTANLDVVFSSEVLQKIIGYSPQEFTQKRKLCKVDPSIKDRLREDLSKAQEILMKMDELMEIELRKNEKALIVNSVKLTKDQKQTIDNRIRLLKL